MTGELWRVGVCPGPQSDGSGAYNRYFGGLTTGKMKIRGIMARKGDTPEYIKRMQQEMFDVLAEARSIEELRLLEPKARDVRRSYIDGLENADVMELAIRRWVSRLNYSKRCAEASAVKAYRRQRVALAPGMVISYVVKDASRWEVDLARMASRIDLFLPRLRRYVIISMALSHGIKRSLIMLCSSL